MPGLDLIILTLLLVVIVTALWSFGLWAFDLLTRRR